MPAPDYDIQENTLRLGWRRQMLPYGLAWSSTLAHSLDDLNDVTMLRHGHDFTVDYRPQDTSTYSLSVSYDGWSTPQQPVHHTLGWGLGAAINQRRTQLQARLRNSYSFADAGLTGISAYVTARLSHTFPWHHTLSASQDFSATYEPSSWTPSETLALTYTVPFEIPVSRRKNTAIVSGHVYRSATGEAMPGVLLRLNGLAAVTDREGAFAFYLPEAGTKYLHVDSSTTGTNMIPSKPTPIPVSASPSSRVVVDIGMVQAASVTGSVAVYGYPEGPTADSAGSGNPSARGSGGSAAYWSSCRITRGPSAG